MLTTLFRVLCFQCVHYIRVFCSVCSVVFTMCSPQMMLSISACPTHCESCYLHVDVDVAGTTTTTTKCLLSGCQHGYTRKSDGKCAGESVCPHSANVLVHQCVLVSENMYTSKQ